MPDLSRCKVSQCAATAAAAAAAIVVKLMLCVCSAVYCKAEQTIHT